MGELTAEDVATFTDGRLENDNGLGETSRMLDAALRVARRRTGWHVSPVIENDTVILDGPDSRILWLPTRKLADDGITSVEEDSLAIDLAKLSWSAGGPPGILERPIAVRKRSRGWWSGDYQAIEVTMTHGYTEEEAADWRQAILQTVDQMSLIPVSGGTGFSSVGLKTKRVDDVAYGWDNQYVMMAEKVIFSVDSILCDYELPRVEFI